MRTPSELHKLTALRLTPSKTASALAFVLLYFLGALPACAQWTNGYTYRRTITIDHTKVPNTDQSNFPVLISGTYSYLATTGNGGNVMNSNGYDIIFTSDSGGTSSLAYERESYSASTGAMKVWVKVPTVSHTTDTVIYLFYGNSSVTTDQSNKTGVWDSNYKGVWHLEDNAANTTVADSTSNGNNGTSVANTSSKTTTGEIDKGLTFNGSSDGITTSITSSKTFTWEAWVNTISSSNYYSIIDFGDSNFMLMQLYGGAGSFWTSDVPLYGVNLGITGLSNGTWYHVVFSRSGDSGTYSAYLNGSLTGTHSSGTWSGTTTIAMGERPAYGGQYFDGALDELRVSNSLRSADWISTEYKNQSSPSTFYTVGAATTCATITSLSPVWGEIDSAVTITGTNFGSTQGSSTVTFNGTTATPTSWSATSISTTVPYGAATGNVVVTVSSAASNGVNFTVSSGGGSDSSGVYYYFSDQLGTARVITDANGTICYNGDLYPYGGERAYTDVCDSNYKFTGKERDDESGLDNFGARYKSSQYGRFMRPDPMGGQRVDPQTLNKYAYVRNNPLAFIDPTGLAGLPTMCNSFSDQGINDPFCTGDWGFGAGYNGPDQRDQNPSSNGFANGGNCSASMGSCGTFGAGNPGDYNSAADFASGSFAFLFQGFLYGKFYFDVFDTWDQYAGWSTNNAAQAAELAYEDKMYQKLSGILNVTDATRVGLHGGNFNVAITGDEAAKFLATDPACQGGAFGIRCADNNLHLTLQENGAYTVHMDSGFLYDPTGWGALKHGAIDVACGWTFCAGGIPH